MVVAEEFRIIDFLRQGRRGMAHYLALLNESAELEGVSLQFGATGLVPWGNTGSGDVLCWRLDGGATHSVVMIEDDCSEVSEDSASLSVLSCSRSSRNAELSCRFSTSIFLAIGSGCSGPATYQRQLHAL